MLERPLSHYWTSPLKFAQLFFLIEAFQSKQFTRGDSVFNVITGEKDKEKFVEKCIPPLY